MLLMQHIMLGCKHASLHTRSVWTRVGNTIKTRFTTLCSQQVHRSNVSNYATCETVLPSFCPLCFYLYNLSSVALLHLQFFKDKYIINRTVNRNFDGLALFYC